MRSPHHKDFQNTLLQSSHWNTTPQTEKEILAIINSSMNMFIGRKQ